MSVVEQLRHAVELGLDADLRAVLGPTPPIGAIWDLTYAHDYVQTARAIAERRTQASAQSFSPSEWLRILRALPEEVWGPWPTTSRGWVARIAETAGGLSKTSSESRSHATEAPGDAPMLDVMSLLFNAIMLARIQTLIKASGAGADLVSDPNYALPYTPPKGPKQEALRIFDERVQQSDLLQFAGSELTHPPTLTHAPPLLVYRFERTIIPVPMQLTLVHEGKSTITNGRYGSLAFGIDSLVDFAQRARARSISWWDDVSRACLALMMLLPAIFQRNPESKVSAYDAGYFEMDRERLRNEIAASIKEMPPLVSSRYNPLGLPTDPAKILKILEGGHGSLWPLSPGPPVRNELDRVLVDLTAVSRRFETGLAYPSDQGAVANLRADFFEENVRSVLARSAWAPSGELEKHIGRELRRKGELITDLDAAGERDGVALLVNARSKMFSLALSHGEWRPLRAQASAARDAVREWGDRVSRLCEGPVDVGVDFSQYRRVIALICTPSPMYADDAEALNEVAPGLRACCSLLELEDWLVGPGLTLTVDSLD
jgi:hypothetical protein